MTPTITWSIVLLLIAAKFASRVYWRNRLERVRRFQKFRQSFASIRRDAIRLLHMGQVQPDSMTFAFLYLASSSLVRRTQDYPKLARAVVRRIVEDSTSSPNARLLRDEMNSWTPDVREVAFRLIKQVMGMTIEFHDKSKPYRESLALACQILYKSSSVLIKSLVDDDDLNQDMVANKTGMSKSEASEVVEKISNVIKEINKLDTVISSANTAQT